MREIALQEIHTEFAYAFLIVDGLALIAGSFWWVRAGESFPGYAALLPVRERYSQRDVFAPRVAIKQRIESSGKDREETRLLPPATISQSFSESSVEPIALAATPIRLHIRPRPICWRRGEAGPR